MKNKSKILISVFLSVIIMLGIAGCDFDSLSESKISPDDIEIAVSEIDSQVMIPFDKVRKSEIVFNIDGLEEGVLKFIAEEEVYPDKLQFDEGKIKIEEVYSFVEDDRIRVIVENTEGQQVKELFLDMDSSKTEVETADLLSLDEEPGEKLLGFLVDPDYSREYDHWIYFDNWYIKDFDFFQQFNLLIYLLETEHHHHRKAYYLDEFNNRYGSWEEYKVVGRKNLKEVDGEFDNFFRNEGFNWEKGILVYLDAEKNEYVSSLGYQFPLIEEIRVAGETEHFDLHNLTWKDLIDKFLEDDDFNFEIKINIIGDKELDGDALKDILEIKRGRDFIDYDVEYGFEQISAHVHYHDHHHHEHVGRLVDMDFSRKENGIAEGWNTFDKPEYFYYHIDEHGEKHDPKIGDIYHEVIHDGYYNLEISYQCLAVIFENGHEHHEWLHLFHSHIDFSVHHQGVFEVNFENYDQEITQGEMLEFDVRVKNTGYAPDSQHIRFDMEYIVDDWHQHEGEEKYIHLDPGEETWLSYEFLIHPDASTEDYLEMWVHSYNDQDHLSLDIIER